MKDLTSARLIKLKGILFLAVGVLSSTLLILEAPTVKVGVLLAVSVWCFCRFYYFAFYVIEHYVEAGYRFSGFWSFFVYMVGKRGGKVSDAVEILLLRIGAWFTKETLKHKHHAVA